MIYHSSDGSYSIINAIPSNVKPNVGKRDKIVWLDSLNNKFLVKITWGQLKTKKQEVKWYDIAWFKNAILRQSFLLWLTIQQKLTTQDKLQRFGFYGPNYCSLRFQNNEDHNLFDCSH
jgi:hypothetical protein